MACPSHCEHIATSTSLPSLASRQTVHSSSRPQVACACIGIDLGMAKPATAVSMALPEEFANRPMSQPWPSTPAAAKGRHLQCSCGDGTHNQCLHNPHHPGRRQVPGCRQRLDAGGTQCTAYSRQRRRWECQSKHFLKREEARRARVPGLRELLMALATQGAGHDSSRRQAVYLSFLASQWHLLRQPFVLNTERLYDKQRRCELDHSSKDGYVEQVIRPAVQETPPGTPIVITLGAELNFGGFKLRGKAPTPSTAMERAFIRGVHAGAGGCSSRDVHIVWVSEYHTSMHCFRCGHLTEAPELGSKSRRTQHRSTRLRECAECSENLQKQREARGKKVLFEGARRPWTVDRDVQGALNIAYIGLAWFFKQARPFHLSTPEVQEAWRRLGWAT